MTEFASGFPPKPVPCRRRHWRAIILADCAVFALTVVAGVCAVAVMLVAELIGLGALGVAFTAKDRLDGIRYCFGRMCASSRRPFARRARKTCGAVMGFG